MIEEEQKSEKQQCNRRECLQDFDNQENPGIRRKRSRNEEVMRH
jgi:hypothetical protein